MASERDDEGNAHEPRPLAWAEVELLRDELKQVARHALRRHRGHDLRATELLHTALRRMFAGNRSWDYELLWENRAHVFGAFRKAAAGALVEEQRKRSAGKRGAVTLSFDELLDSPALLRDEPALALDFLGCLEHVRKSNPVGAQVLEHSVLMGFDWSEICGLVELSERHARRRLLRALALAREFWEQR